MKLKQYCRRMLSAAAAAMMLLCSVPHMADAADGDIVFSGISGLPFDGGDPFKGVDVSSVIALEQSGVKFYDHNGRENDIFRLLKEAGVNTVRVRIWNDPTNSQTGASYGGGANDVNCAVQIASRCAAADLKLLVDFHYSDFWADPEKQRAPKAWEQLSVDEKADAIYSFTSDTLAVLRNTGAEIAMVQVGNETTTGMCGVYLADYDWSEEGWQQLAKLWNAGASAVRAFDENTLVALHFTNPEKSSNYSYYAKMLDQCGVDYDVFATSYYPYWHGTLSNLTDVLGNIAAAYGKQVLVAETSWAYTLDDGDSFGNTIGSADALGDYVSYPVSVEGQISFLRDLFTAVASIPNGKGIGVFYWEPAWLPVGSDYQQNSELWERDGSGWASQAAQEYDSSAQYYGGSAVDNQALFDPYGYALDSLYVFESVRGDGERQQTDEPDNLLPNPGFEADGGWTENPQGWQLYSASESGHFDVRAEDAHSGGYALHWYTDTAFRGSNILTSVTVPEDGIYCCAMYMQGDYESQFTFSARSDSAPAQAYSSGGFGWSNWQRFEVSVSAKAGDEITLMFYLSGEAGSYGSVDDFEIVRTGDLPAETTAETTAAETTTTEETTTTATTVTEAASIETEHTTEAEPADGLLGDLDCDGALTISDAVLLSRLAAEEQGVQITEQGIRNGDCDRDRSITPADTIVLLKMLAGMV